MKLSRKEEMMWHYAEPTHCGWAQYYANHDEFDEHIEVSSIDEVGEFCTMCREEWDA